MPSEERQGELEAYPKDPSAPLREVVPPLLRGLLLLLVVRQLQVRGQLGRLLVLRLAGWRQHVRRQAPLILHLHRRAARVLRLKQARLLLPHQRLQPKRLLLLRLVLSICRLLLQLLRSLLLYLLLCLLLHLLLLGRLRCSNMRHGNRRCWHRRLCPCRQHAGCCGGICPLGMPGRGSHKQAVGPRNVIRRCPGGICCLCHHRSAVLRIQARQGLPGAAGQAGIQAERSSPDVSPAAATCDWGTPC